MDETKMHFPNLFPYEPWSIVSINFLILLFNLVFFYCYVLFKKRIVKKINQLTIDRKVENYFTPLVILVLCCFSIIIVLSNFNYLINELVKSVYFNAEGSIADLLIKKKVLFFVPLGAIAITYKYLKSKNKLTANSFIVLFIFFILVALLMVLKNPLTEKRNALGPIYITLIYLFYPKLLNTNVKFFLFLFVAMIVAFPLISSITHLNASLSEIIRNPEIFTNTFIDSGHFIKVFNSLNYDAYANILATVEYTKSYGLSFGYQLLGVIFFFIPRAFWVSKPISTGKVIGNYLIDKFNFGDGTFNNLSNPLVSEAYINFGIFGILITALTFALICVKFLGWLRSGDSLKEFIAFYFSVHLIFLLRGDLSNGIAYFIGPLIAVYILPKIIYKLLRI
ncbi:O-antigen polymerase [Gaetbulibacter sp. M240]|uniref:O-antigen polymerase n=1 Tax=Gaetbulibacter sp. M240 TaxID=3126511 RepID=UPI00374FD6B3